jgi:hydroxymethylpyrimidine pyrophosphatase-like HAD family hydrolase
MARPASVDGPLLIALDIDGTLIDWDERLSDRVREAVTAVAQAGHHVVIATGRSLHGTLPILDRLGLTEGWAVCSNGSVTLRLDPMLDSGYEIADTVTFDPGPALKLLREHLPTAVYLVEGPDAAGTRLVTAPFPDGELTGPVRVVSFDELVAGPTTRVVVRSVDHSPQDFVDVVRDSGLHGVNYAVGWTAWLDLAPDGVSKASALEVVRGRLGLPASATLAVGDGRNDLEMFAWAARSVAMGQATDDVRAAATQVTAAVEEDGAALVLEALLG